MNKIQGNLTGIALLMGVGLIGCEQNNPQPNEPQCNCHEVHEVLEPVMVNGMPQMQWLIESESVPVPADCNTETDYYYNSNETQRWRTICQ